MGGKIGLFYIVEYSFGILQVKFILLVKHSLIEPLSYLGVFCLPFTAIGIKLPIGERSVFGYFVDIQQCEFIPWSDLVPNVHSLIQRGKNIIRIILVMSLK